MASGNSGADPKLPARLCPHCQHWKDAQCELIVQAKITENDCGIWTASVKKLPFFEPKIADEAPFPLPKKRPATRLGRPDRPLFPARLPANARPSDFFRDVMRDRWLRGGEPAKPERRDRSGASPQERTVHVPGGQRRGDQRGGAQTAQAGQVRGGQGAPGAQQQGPGGPRHGHGRRRRKHHRGHGPSVPGAQGQGQAQQAQSRNPAGAQQGGAPPFGAARPPQGARHQPGAPAGGSPQSGAPEGGPRRSGARRRRRGGGRGGIGRPGGPPGAGGGTAPSGPGPGGNAPSAPPPSPGGGS